MYVFVVFIITQAAKDWLIKHGAAIGREPIHDLQIVYLPVSRFVVIDCVTDRRQPSMIALKGNWNDYIFYDEQANTFDSRLFTQEYEEIPA